MEQEKNEEVKNADIILTDDEAEAVVGGIQSKDFFSKIADIIAETPSLEPKETRPAPKPYL